MSYTAHQCFIAIVEGGSLASAARRLHLSPSAVSKQLSSLEERLNTQLIQRSTRSLNVTEAGEHFYRRCVEIMGAVEAAETEVRDLGGRPEGTLRLTLPQALVGPDFARLVAGFRQQHPGLSVDLEVSDDLARLIDRRLDAGFRIGPLPDSRLVAVTLFQAPVLLSAAPAYLERYGAPQTASQMNEHTLLIPSYVYLNASAAGPLRTAPAIDLGRHILCDSVSMLRELALAGAGLALTLEYPLAADIAAGSLQKLNAPITHAPRPVSLVYPSRDYLPRRLEVFIQHTRRHYRGGDFDLPSTGG